MKANLQIITIFKYIPECYHPAVKTCRFPIYKKRMRELPVTLK